LPLRYPKGRFSARAARVMRKTRRGSHMFIALDYKSLSRITEWTAMCQQPLVSTNPAEGHGPLQKPLNTLMYSGIGNSRMALTWVAIIYKILNSLKLVCRGIRGIGII
jgi:hypothetical protein